MSLRQVGLKTRGLGLYAGLVEITTVERGCPTVLTDLPQLEDPSILLQPSLDNILYNQHA